MAPAISFVIKMCNACRRYPTVAKISRLIFLPSRTIFFLTFFPKILDDIAEQSLHGAMPPDTEGQMAYIPDRSGTLCVAIQLHGAETCPLAVVNGEWDQVKAFDSGRWEPVILEYEQQLGCGEFLYEYLKGQTYEYIYSANGESRMGFQKKPRIRGVWPGGKFAPHLFSTFQGSNHWIDKSQDVWLSSGKFSDDASPSASWDRVENGDVARQLGGVYQWSKDQFIDFHLSGKKAPKYYVYRKNSDEVKNYHTTLMFGETPFIRDYEKRQLGIKVCFFKDDEKANNYGYFLDWVGKKPLSAVSNRLQERRYAWDTHTLRSCTQAYVVGKLQFAASLHWLRASQQSICKARFDYTMALAACVGATTPEIVGMYCSKVKRVKQTCGGYKELCRYLDLPTLEEMAIKDARSIIRQWAIYEPSDFLWSMSEGAAGLSPVEVHHGVVAPEGSLLSDLYVLSKRDIVVRYPLYHQAKEAETFNGLTRIEKIQISPDYIKDLHVAGEASQDIWEQMGLDEPTNREIANTFWLMIRDKFNVLERYARLCKTLPVASLSQSEKRVYNADPQPAKRARYSISDCASGTPWRRATHSKDNDICRVCGYYIMFKNNLTLSCCGKKAHRNCILNQKSVLPLSDHGCRDLSSYKKRCGRLDDPSVKFSRPLTLTNDQRRAERELRFKDQLVCAVCDKQIESDNPELLRNHLVSECVSVPFDCHTGNNKYKLSRRLAALSSIYRINDGVRVRHRVATMSVPSSSGIVLSLDGVLSEGSGERHTLSPIVYSSDN